MRPHAVALLLLAACSASDGPAATEQATITDSAGITIVQNHHPVWGEGEGWEVSAEPVLVIGSEDALGEARYIATARRLSDGGIVLMTDLGGRWFNAAGELVGQFATQGDGPGEFRYARDLIVLHGDTVVVGTTQKSAWYSQARFLREQAVDWERLRALGRWGECATYLLPDLSRVSCQQDPSIPYSETNRPHREVSPGWTSPGPGVLRQLRRQYLIPVELDTVHALGIDIGIEQQMIDLGSENHTSIVHPFHARSHLFAGGNPMRIASVQNPHWEIEIRSDVGTLLQKIRRDGGRRVPTAPELAIADSVIRAPEGRVLRIEEPVYRDRIMGAIITPDSLPGHLNLVVASTGDVISQQWTYWGTAAPSTFDVFDVGGRWLGTFSLPPKFRLLEVGEDFMLGMQLDSDDMPSVVVYGLVR